MKIGEYCYKPSGRQFRIYVCDYNDGQTSSSKPVYEEPYMFNDREEARKRVYELNGWNYTPRKP